MRSCLIAVYFVFSTLTVFGQSSAKYQTATIMEVKAHQSASDADTKPSYDVSLKVKNAVYVVLYTPQEDTGAAKYAAGRDVLIFVGEKTIKFNDQLGDPLEMPILSKKTVATKNKSK